MQTPQKEGTLMVYLNASLPFGFVGGWVASMLTEGSPWAFLFLALALCLFSFMFLTDSERKETPDET